MDESCRLLMFKGRKEEGKEILAKIIKETDPTKMYYVEDEQYIIKLDNWISYINTEEQKEENKAKFKIKDIFKD